MSTDTQAAEPASPRWRPLEAIERRVLGVLIEKAKTTPESYPLSLNAVRVGSNQKSNRAPMMQLEEDQVDEALENLRKVGAVAQIQGDGRVDKYRHLAYEWLGVEKVELAVMAELLLRGTQTVGELRGRASRMEPIKDLGDLQPTLDSLHAKGLITYLSPPGRGSLVTHALYLDREVEKVRREAGAMQPVASHVESEEAAAPRGAFRAAPSSVAAFPAASISEQLLQLRNELADVKSELAAARSEFETTAQQLRLELDELNRQLGN
jgi:uncharacterized protein YceH (UPF0502 family)